MSLRPLIVVVGTTGVGKSNFAIELALHLSRNYHGRSPPKVINADAMQVYAGMDLITNKVPADEQKGVEHLLMGFREPSEQYVVGQWVNDATKLIEKAYEDNQIPIVVGGTSYWIQHLLFPDRLVNPNPLEHKSSSMPTNLSNAMSTNLENLPPELLDLFNTLPEYPPNGSKEPEKAFTMYRILSLLDPVVASRWHWKETRRVHRSICVMKETGRLVSETIADQSKIVSTPRYRTLCFWLYAQRDVLHGRLNKRIDVMLEEGLLDEVKALQKLAAGTTENYTSGIYQSIGYREFNDFLASPQSKKLLDEAADRMKISTRQYAKRQISWLRNKLLPLFHGANLEETSSTYVLDATNIDEWSRNVLEPGLMIADAFVTGMPLPDPLGLSEAARELLEIDLSGKPTQPSEVLHARQKRICELCTTSPSQPVMIEEIAWKDHTRSKMHKKRKKFLENSPRYPAPS